MTRSGMYETEDNLAHGRFMGRLMSAIRGKRGQVFLQELAQAMDKMPEKALIVNELIDVEGNCCTLGVVCKFRNLNVSFIDIDDPQCVGESLDIASVLAAEIEYENDEGGHSGETPELRWVRMREWVETRLTRKKEG